jgi:predicted nucleotidyltransferase
MSDLFEYFEVLSTLNDHDVKYVLIGGLAANLWGSDNITQDVDVCYERDRQNIAALVKALKSMDAHLRGFPKGLPEIIDERSFQLGDTMTFDTKFGKFDCLATPSGTSGFADLAQHAALMDIGKGVTVLVADIDDIIRMKRTAGRAKDLSAVENLKVLKVMRRNLEEPASS